MTASPKRITMQISAGPKRSATRAIVGARVIAATPPARAPIVDAMMQMPSARAASPRSIIG